MQTRPQLHVSSKSFRTLLNVNTSAAAAEATGHNLNLNLGFVMQQKLLNRGSAQPVAVLFPDKLQKITSVGTPEQLTASA